MKTESQTQPHAAVSCLLLLWHCFLVPVESHVALLVTTAAGSAGARRQECLPAAQLHTYGQHVEVLQAVQSLQAGYLVVEEG